MKVMKVTKEAKIGLFAVITIAALFWGLNFLKGKNVFSPSYTYYAIYTRVDGLKPTNDVMLSGYKVGTVKSIQFEDGFTGNLIVAIQVEKKYPIPLGSVVKLISSDIMGGKAIRLEISENKNFHQPYDTINASIETGLLDQIVYEMGPMKDKAESLMSGMESVMIVLQEVFKEDNLNNLDQSFLSLRNSLENIETISRSMGSLLGSDSSKFNLIVSNLDSITSNLKGNKEKINTAIENFSSISDSIAKSNISSMLAHADSTLMQLNDITSKINKGNGTMGMLLHNDTLYNNLEKASRNLELLLLDIKTNPRRYINFSIIDLSRDRYEKNK
jgi:phospholipid/cholesterol/gamma-HCH transport system substrate-binding protein